MVNLEINPTRIIPRKLEEGQELLLTACTHIGSEHTDERCLRNFLKSAEHNPYVLVGDILDLIALHDRRNKHNMCKDERKATIQDAKNAAERYLRKSAHNCIGLIRGNHEWTASDEGHDCLQDIAKVLKIPYVGDELMLALRLGRRKPVGVYLEHGSNRFSNNTGNLYRDEANRQERLRRKYGHMNGFDLVVSAHAHVGVTSPPVFTSVQGPDMATMQRVTTRVQEYSGWICSLPSMYDGFTAGRPSYPKRMGLKPSATGWYSVRLGKQGIDRLTQWDRNGDVFRVYTALNM